MIKTITSFALSIFMLAAVAAPPSNDSIDVLLQVSGAELGARQSQDEFGESVRDMVYGELKAHKPNQAQIQIAERLIKKLDSAIEFEFSWERVKPVVARAYRESFSQEEIDELIRLYKSSNVLIANARLERADPRVRELYREQLAPGKARMIADIRTAVREMQAAR